MEIFRHNLDQRRPAGFTLIELLVVIGVIAILTAIGVPTYANVQQNLVVNTSSEELANSIRLAQSKAISSQAGEAWGVHFDTTSYTVYSGDWAAPATTIVYELDSTVEIISTTSNELVFERLTGISSNETIVIGLSGGNQRTIAVSATGSISLL